MSFQAENSVTPSRTISVEALGIEKAFGGVAVLHSVNIAIRSGEIHALVGANGSGKTTLIKTLCGNYRPDAGEIVVRGEHYDGIASPRKAADLGIRVVHQEAPLIDILSVGECMALFRRYATGVTGRILWREVYGEAGAVLRRVGVNVDPRALASSLSAPDRALVALAVALADTSIEDTSLLILDEASASVPEASAERFLVHVKRLAEQSVPILMVTHRLREVEAYADTVTILDDGRVAYQGPVAETNIDEMVTVISGARMSVSRNVDTGDTRTRFEIDSGGDSADTSVSEKKQALEVVGLTTNTLRNVGLQVAAGEIVGVVGGPESGVDELPLALVGAIPATATNVAISGTAAKLARSPREALKQGIVLVPRDRLREGAIGSLPIHENVLLPTYRRYWHRGALAGRVVTDVIQRLRVRPNDARVLLRELSGGNQQKVILGKWLNCSPKVIVLDDPTSGIDPGARKIIFSEVKARARQGELGVLLLSTEPEQLAEHCDRAVVIHKGEVVEELREDQLSHANVARWAAA